MSKMIQTSEELEQANGIVINGIDNANLMSVDSTEPIQTGVDAVGEDGEVLEKRIGKVKETEKEDEDENEESEEDEIENEDEEKIEKSEKKEEPTDPDTEVLPSDSKNVQKRIGKLTKRMRTAERSITLKDEKIAELESLLEKAQEKLPDETKPLKEDYEDEDEYLEALVEWKTETKLKALRSSDVSKIKDKEEKAAVLEVFEDLDSAIEAGEKKYPDFREVTGDEDLILSEDVLKITMETEIPADIMYYLASNPDESERISSLSVFKAAKEIGKIELELMRETTAGEKRGKPAPTPKKQSKAPEPIVPVVTHGTTEKDPNKMSMKEYKAWRNKK